MAILSSAAGMSAHILPKLVTPEIHRTSDYLISGSLIVGGAIMWRSSRHASVASLICGGALLGLTFATHYPGRRKKPLGYPRHGRAETAMAVLMAALPEALRLPKGPRRYFTAHSAALTALTNLTSFGGRPRS